MDRLPASTMNQAEPALAHPSEDTPHYSFADTPALTRALRKGNEHAYTWLHNQWSSRLARYSFAISAGDDTFASEITQATWLRIVRHIRVLPDEAALWNWIARAARSAASDQRRTGSRYRRALARLTGVTEFWRNLESNARSQAETQADDLHQALDIALSQLDPTERALIEARYFTTDTLETIATRHHLTVRAVEGRLARLRKRLRQEISEIIITSHEN